MPRVLFGRDQTLSDTRRHLAASTAVVLVGAIGYSALGLALSPMPMALAAPTASPVTGIKTSEAIVAAEVMPIPSPTIIPTVLPDEMLRADGPIVRAAKPPKGVPDQAVRYDGALAGRSVLPDIERAARDVAPSGPSQEDQAQRARAVLAQAERSFDAGHFRAALDALDAGPVPSDLGDLVGLRRAELALNLGDGDRARAELARPELAATTNRMVLVRAAGVAERLQNFSAAGEFWVRASRQPTWYAERVKAMKSAALDFLKAGQSDRVADMLAALVDVGGRSPQTATDLQGASALGDHHAALLSVIRGDFSAASALFRRYLAQNPNGEYAAAAKRRLDALNRPDGDPGWEAVRELDTAEGYRAWIQGHPTHARVPDARFFQGLANYRDGRYQEAIDAWAFSTGPDTLVESRAQALYWIGKALRQLGQVDASRQRWSAAAALRPSSYYSVRASDRLAGAYGWPDGGTALPDTTPGPAEESDVERWLGGWAGAAATPSDREQVALRRAPLFASIGLERTASAELDGLIESSENPRVIYRAGKQAVENGLWPSSVRAGLRLGRLAPERSSADSPRAVRRLSYPVGYRDAVANESARRDLGPLLLLSLIRQESLFDRFALSSTDARGLTQVMPATGAELARSIGRTPFSPDDLFDPILSVAFGARYLAAEIKAFDGDIFRAVAAYNAGGGAAARWASGTDDPDVFVESISYAETREYVKSIYQYHAAYRSLVDSTSPRS